MILETARLILRPWEETDAEDLYEFAKDERIGPAAGWPPHTSVENSTEIIRSVLSEPETYAICMKCDNKAIGCIGLMIGHKANHELPDTEGEIGYWLGSPFWGKGIMPEAVRELIRHAFCELHIEKLWCGYFDGNNQSKRVQEKCGFVYHHTNEKMYWKLTNEILTEHISCLTYERWKQSVLRIEKLSEKAKINMAAEWFHSKWKIPLNAYRESMEASFCSGVPSWYLCFDGEKIIAGMGVIENDFHDRKDLTPNVCAVYTEAKYRNQGIAGRLLDFVCEDMKRCGIDILYLITDHIGFYERYGWEFLCMVKDEGEEEQSRMYIHKYHA